MWSLPIWHWYSYTHVHSDHFGNTLEIATEAKCPVAFHRADQPIVDRANNGPLRGVGLRGKIMARVFSEASFRPANGDLFVLDGLSLIDFGCDAKIMVTPGHTPGSISIVTPDGDAIIGDRHHGWLDGWAAHARKAKLSLFCRGFAFGHEEPGCHLRKNDRHVVRRAWRTVGSPSSSIMATSNGEPIMIDYNGSYSGAKES